MSSTIFLPPLHPESLGNYLFSWDDGDVVHYQHFVRQLHHLQTLILGYTQIKGDALLDILRSTPELVNLVVDSCMVTYKSFLAGLTYNPDYEYHSILPKLESFTMYIDSEDARFYESFEEEMVGLIEVLLKMIHSRTRPLSMDDSYPGNGPARLRKVLLCHDDDSAFTTHFKLPLQASQDLCGLDFTILEDSAKEDWATEKEWFW
ncbi:hypothetical protein CPB84DRAFT_290429 [Gymnopilus junonius]|uniref:Uncharacterized protein n=1 Tax=Gymnopilus junonius TaxID=109634 RepID=A0A9P5NF25_GYMJU|nr:hypothetical protein CPB84DRAFT_290429 [Gymnopilus junonius]